MIQTISIANFRSCLKTSFSPHPHLSVLIGPNGSGKTNVLQAIMLLKQLANQDPVPYRTRDSDLPTAQSVLKVTFSIRGKPATLRAVINTHTDANNHNVIVSSRQSWLIPHLTKHRFGFELFSANLHHPRRKHYPHLWNFHASRKREGWRVSESSRLPKSALAPIEQIATWLAGLQYYSASQFTNPSRCPVSFAIDEDDRGRYSFRSSSHERLLADLYSAFKSRNTEAYRRFESIVGPSGLGLVDKLTFKEIETSSIEHSVRVGGRVKEGRRKKQLIIPQFTVGRHTLSPNQLSEGTFRTITLLFYLMTRSSTMLLIEEPEVCVHHGLLSSIVEVIKNYATDKQIMISTHSDFVLDHVRPENVFRVQIGKGKGTEVESLKAGLSRRDYSALREYLRTEGNLGEYWRHGGLD